MKTYAYLDILKLDKELKLNLNDTDRRILQHRMYSLNDMFRTILDNNKINYEKIKKEIFYKTHVNLKIQDIECILESINKNSTICNEYYNSLKKADFIGNQLGGNISQTIDNSLAMLNIYTLIDKKSLFPIIRSMVHNIIESNWINANENLIKIIKN
jgi:hypothetical protein